VSGAAAFATALPRPQRSQVWSIGGGKGGIGKSVLAASLGWQLARLGKRVVLVDADLGGANLHTCLGVPGPSRTLGDFIQRRVERLEDVVVDTPFPRLRLISGASDVLGAANINYQQKVRLLNKLRSLDVDVVLIDLGAGTAHNIIDFFLISDVALLAVVPEPTSIENGYRFIKSALYRRLRNAAPSGPVRDVIDAALDPKNAQGIRSPVDLLTAVERQDPAAVLGPRRELAEFHPRFIVNQVRSPADIAVGHQLVTACARHLGVRGSYAGFVHYDDVVWRAVRQRRLFAEKDPDSAPADDVRRIARGLVEGETLALRW